MSSYKGDAIKGYSNYLRAICSRAEDDIAKVIFQWIDAHPEATVASIRDFATQAIVAGFERYGLAASELSCLVYEELFAELGYDDTQTLLLEELEPGLGDRIKAEADKIARYQATKIAGVWEPEAFSRMVGQSLAGMVHDAANRTTIMNTLKDKRQTRFARVLMGKDSCAFCVMLASRGFVYATEQSAELFDHNHRNCDCVVIAGDAEMRTIEGYDLQKLYDSWIELRDIEAQPNLSSAEKKLQRMEYMRAHPPWTEKSNDEFFGPRTMRLE